jgi:hypothetical protein
MRLWSIHPKYLDTKGLTACWRESLLARKVLTLQTKGYKHHPQLKRFSAQPDPLSAINQYLLFIFNEALRRGFAFDNSKLNHGAAKAVKIPITTGQMIFEINHLKKKLWQRDRLKYSAIKMINIPLPNPVFKVIKGDIEEWEKKH